MATIPFTDRENAGLVPTLKARQRLQSAPATLKTPLTAKKFHFHTPLHSHRKALGAFNKITATPAINRQEKSQKTHVSMSGSSKMAWVNSLFSKRVLVALYISLSNVCLGSFYCQLRLL